MMSIESSAKDWIKFQCKRYFYEKKKEQTPENQHKEMATKMTFLSTEDRIFNKSNPNYDVNWV